MFDTATARDVIVINDPDEPQSVQLDEEEDVHRIVNGHRHKMVSDQSTTSCGVEWHMATDPAVPVGTWKAGDPLCPVCFTLFERAVAEMAKATRRSDSEIINIKRKK